MIITDSNQITVIAITSAHQDCQSKEEAFLIPLEKKKEKKIIFRQILCDEECTTKSENTNQSIQPSPDTKILFLYSHVLCPCIAIIKILLKNNVNENEKGCIQILLLPVFSKLHTLSNLAGSEGPLLTFRYSLNTYKYSRNT